VTSVVVIGGGISGLACAYELVGGADGPTASSPEVTVLDAGQLGGKLRSAPLGGKWIDVGPDGFLARRPEAAALVHELGAADQLEPVGASGAWVFARGRLRRLPEGLALGVPTRLRDLRTSDMVGMLGILGAARASVDLFAPRPARRTALPDRAIGPLVADKLGKRVVEVLVDPLVGGIHAGRVRTLSAAAVFPPLLAAAQRRGSLMRALRAAPGGAAGATGPAFLTLRDGLGALPGLLEAQLCGRGVVVRADTAALEVHRGAPGARRWVVETATGPVPCDAVVLATPPAPTAALLGGHDENAAVMLGTIDTASVATIALQLNADDVELPDGGTGLLVPVRTARGMSSFLSTAVTFLDRKWPHLAREGQVLLRVSVGRVDDVRFAELDDAALVELVTDELNELLGTAAAPVATLVARWPASFPQYHVNHLVRVEGIESAVHALGGVTVAGAAYRGIGVPACIASGRSAARHVRSWFADQS
jgi:oxygen-dependent protoporphyrinogen oxidase